MPDELKAPSRGPQTRSTSSPTARLLRQQENLADLATQSARARALLDRPAEQAATRNSLQRKINALEKLWTECATTHRELLLDDEESDVAAYLENGVHAAARSQYYALVEALENAVDAAPPAPGSAEQPSSSGDQSTRQPQSALERVPVPTFDGSLKEWPNFRDLFTALVIEDQHLSNVVKFTYLKRALRGNAQSIIRNLDISGNNFLRAWDLVKDHYQDVNALTFDQIVRLVKLEPADSRKPGQLERLFLQTREVVASLESLGEPVKEWSSFLVVLTLLRLDPEIRKDWDHLIGRRASFPRFEELEAFMQTRIHSDSHCSIKSGVTTHRDNAFPSRANKAPENRAKFTAHVSTSDKRICGVCRGSHETQSCGTLLRLMGRDRLNAIYTHSLCANCLIKGHRPRACKSTRKCNQCQRRHHSLLHDSYLSFPGVAGVTASSSETTSSDTVPVSAHTATELHQRSVSSNRKEHVLLATAIVRVRSSRGRETTLRALIDQGSERSFISESAAQLLRVDRCAANANISGIGGQNPGVIKHMTHITVSASNSTNQVLEINVNCLILAKLTSYAPNRLVKRGDWQHVNHLSLADPDLHNARAIDLILGADVYGQIIREGLIKFPDEPIAQLTVFGWILSGPHSSSRSPGIPSGQTPDAFASLHVTTHENLSESLIKFWEIEETPAVRFLTDEERRCEELFMATTQRDTLGRYTVHLPFRTDLPVDIGDSRTIASKQYDRLERRLARDPALSRDYHAFLADYLERGHMSLYSPRSDQRQTCYIPHHPVIKQSSSTTKVRVVFNASCQTTNGKSLNDALLTGPKLQQDLSAIILRWRMHRYVMVADAEKMFRQIKVTPIHAPYQLILWRPSATEPVKTFQLDTVTYGTASAPYLSLRVLQQLATDERHEFPAAAEQLVDNTYVDDIVFGASSIEDARSLRNDISALTQRGGFSFRKWASNEPHLLADIPPELCESTASREFVVDDHRKVLGISWSAQEDHFHYSTIPDLPTAITKRSILSFIAKLYDPLGWLSPIVIIAKVFMQQLWQSQLAWDEVLSPALVAQWSQFSETLHCVQGIRIPRWVGIAPNSTSQLHLFCDASQHAYAAAIYLRIDTGHEIITRLLISKTKVAPLKSLTIPRLELCAAELGSRLLVWTIQGLSRSDIPCFAWSDSSVTLAWIAASPSRWKVFVANRVSRIQSRSSNISWHYVPTADNPADIASRGCCASNLREHSLWWQGPAWLLQSRASWPSALPEPASDIDQEERSVMVHLSMNHQSDEQHDIARRCSDWGRLIRAAAVFLRYLDILKAKVRKEPTDHLRCPSSEVLFAYNERARIQWLLVAQAHCFAQELRIIRSKGVLPHRNRLISLSPYLDQDNILRVGGRLDNAALLDEGKHPVVLGNCHITQLIIRHAHLRTLHGGMSLTARLLAERYWIVRAKTLVKAAIRHCVSCVRFRATMALQRMAPLPAVRVNRRRAFQHVGIDYAGPVLLKYGSGRGRQAHKAYISVFVCLTTRAIHLELVHAYTTAAFLAALKRFTARRGLPSLIMSDNGTNFKGASRELARDLKQAVSDPLVAAQLADDQIQWRFIPPGSPHFGGMWESGVKSVKHHLRRVLGDRTLDAEEFNTLLCQIEACLNSRPIAGFSNDPDDLSYLTPGHFLIGTALLAPPEPSLGHIKESRLSRWQMVQAMVERFWKVWSSDYLRSVQTRNKWRDPQPNMAIGSIVLVKDENSAPAKWALGRVLKTYPGEDGLTRVCQVRTSTSTLVRPVHKLCVLPVTDDVSDHD